MRSLHVGSSKDLFTVPVLNEHKLLEVFRILVKPDAVAGIFVPYHHADDFAELASGLLLSARPDGASDQHRHGLGIRTHLSPHSIRFNQPPAEHSRQAECTLAAQRSKSQSFGRSIPREPNALAKLQANTIEIASEASTQ